MRNPLLTRLGILALGIAALAPAGLAQAGATSTAPLRVPAGSLSGTSDDVDALERWARVLQARLPMGAHATPIQSATSAAFLTQIAVPAEDVAALIPGSGGTILIMRIYIPATQRDELFTVYVPPADPAIAQPLLTCFHAYGLSHLDIAANTTYLREASDRLWFMIAPLQHGGEGLFDVNYGSSKSALHVETVIDYMLRHYHIDRDRLYAVGFSMGGGSALSYASRYRDRRIGAFAAVVNHTGTLALADVYENVQATVRSDMFELFGGSPTDRPFQYMQSSVIELDATDQLQAGGAHMAINLESVSILSIYGIEDQLGYLVNQQLRFDEFMTGLPMSSHTLQPTSVPTTDPQCNGNRHCWGTADETMVCDWLAQHTLNRSPSAGRVLADRSARWHFFDVTVQQQDVFGRFDFEVEVPVNLLRLTETEEVAAIGVDLRKIELDVTVPVTLDVRSIDGSVDRFELRGFDSTPSILLRDGMQLMKDCGAAGTGAVGWCFDEATDTLIISDDGGSWTIIPA